MAYKGSSIVDYLKSTGQSSSMSARKKLAEQYGIKNYTGTAAQNTSLLKQLRSNTSASSTQTGTSSSSGKTGYTSQANNPEAILSVAEQLDLLKSNVGGVENNYVRPEYVDVIDPTMRSSDSLADLYGLDYDIDSIMQVYQDAVDAEYTARHAQQGISEREFYDQMASLQDTALDTIRQQQSQAIQSGATKGMQAANQLSAILGVSQQAGENATDLAEQRYMLGQEEGSARSKAQLDAQQYYDQMGLSLADLAKQIYSYDTQQQAAQLGYNQGINTDYAGVMAQEMAARAAIEQALAQGASNIMGTHTSSISNLLGNRYTADQNLIGTKYAADANLAAARASAAAMSRSGGGGSGGGGGGEPPKDDEGLTQGQINSLLGNNINTSHLPQTKPTKASPGPVTNPINRGIKNPVLGVTSSFTSPSQQKLQDLLGKFIPK